MPNPQNSLLLSFSSEINDSIQVGDEVYWNSLVTSGGFDHDLPSTTVWHIGMVSAINYATFQITIASPHVDGSGNLLPNIQPPINSFITFTKDNVVNNRDLTGYYASVQFQNNSKAKAELFSIGSEVSESSN